MENKIKQFREWQGISQENFALMCDISKQTLNKIEDNQSDPTLQLAFDIAKYLNVRIDEVFINEEEGEK